VANADSLVSEVMEARGYPIVAFTERAEIISVDHPIVVDNYRAAHAIAIAPTDKPPPKVFARPWFTTVPCLTSPSRHIARKKGNSRMTMPFRKDEADTREMTTVELEAARSTGEVSRIEEGDTDVVPSGFEIAQLVLGEKGGGFGRARSTPMRICRRITGRAFGAHGFQASQTDFVDEPRSAVQKADSLVASTMQQLAEAFSRERSDLEQQWDRGDNISTEDLRVAFQRYRSFFRRLLSL
jgi:hypothetical protein